VSSLSLKEDEVYLTINVRLGWQFQVAIGWSTAIFVAAVAMCGPYHMAYPSYQYNREEAALYNALSPILWSSFLAWCTFAATNGYAGKINKSFNKIFSG
jgi:hypothetical protein